MCSNEEIEEMIETFKELPDLYQQCILGVVRDRKMLYDSQRHSPNPTLRPHFQRLKNEVEDFENGEGGLFK